MDLIIVNLMSLLLVVFTMVTMSVTDFIKRFIYERGVRFLDGWRYINKKPYKGDCDDFMWTILVIIEGSWLKAMFAVLTFKAVFWHVRSTSNKGFSKVVGAHGALWHRDYGWIDSTLRFWRPTLMVHQKRWPQLFPWVLFRVLWGTTIGRFIK